MAENEELKNLLIKVKEESEKAGWKLKTQHAKKKKDQGIQSHHFMANNRETMETVRDFILGGSKITADGDCSHEIKRCWLLGRKVMTNLGSILKSRDIILPTKVWLIKAKIFQCHIWMWNLDYKESWAPKKLCFWTVVLEKALESPWTARRFNQSILKEISPEYSLEGLMLKLQLYYFGHLKWRTDSL